MNLQAVTGVRGDERPAAAVLLHAQIRLRRAPENGSEFILVERHADVVDPRDLPVARLHDHVHHAPLELREPELESVAIELLPWDSRLDGQVLLADRARSARRV